MNRSEHEDIEALLSDSDWMRRLSRRLVFDADAAEDLVQDAWVVALEGRARIRGGTGRFVAGVIRRLSYAHHRGEASRHRRETIATEILRPDAPDDVADLTAQVERQRMLSAMVLALPETYRQVVLLRYFEGLSQREIAARIGAPRATVNSRLTRALAILRDDLDRRHGGDRAQWIASLAPLAAPPSLLGTLAAGVLIMNYKYLALGALVLLAMVAVPIATWQSDRAPVVTTVADAAHVDRGSFDRVVPEVTRLDVASSARPSWSAEGTQVDPTDPLSTRPIRALLSADQTPAAGARVFFVGRSAREFTGRHSGDAARARAGYGPPLHELLESFAWSTATDDRGEAYIPGDDDGEIFVFLGDLMGRSDVRAASTPSAVPAPVDVLLEERREVHATVINAAGEPVADVPVRIAIRMFAGAPQRTVAVERSDEAGRVGFLINPFLPMLEAVDAELSVGLAVPSEREVSRRVHASGAEAPVVLQLPVSAVVRVVVQDDEGRPAQDDTLVRLRLAGAEEPDDARDSFELTVDGTARFAHVGLGLDVVASAFASPERFARDVSGSSPRTDGAETELRMTLVGRAIEVVARWVDEQGLPWRDQSLWIALPGDRSLAAKTDSNGVLRADLPADVSSGITIEFSCTGAAAAVPLSLSIAPLDVGSSSVDLGTLVMKRRPIIAAGVVVNQAGIPLPDYWVVVAREGDHAVGDPAWVGLGDAPAVTDANGRFVFREAPAESPAWLYATRGTHPEGAPILFRAAEDLRIVVPLRSRFCGSLLLDKGVPVARMTVAFWDESQGEPDPMFGRGWEYASVRVSGVVQSPELVPGTYTMAFASGIDDRNPVWVRGVQVGVAESSDPRVNPIDLRGRYRGLTLRVHDEEGDAVRANAFAMFSDGDVLQLGSSHQPLVVPVDPRPEAIVVEADGYFLVSLSEIDGVHDVVLRRGFEIELTWPVGEPFPQAPLTAIAEVVPTTPSPSEGGRSAIYWLRHRGPLKALFGADQVARIRVLEAGEHAVSISIERDRDGYVDIERLTPGKSPPTIYVNPPASGSVARFVAPIPPGSAAPAIGRLSDH